MSANSSGVDLEHQVAAHRMKAGDDAVVDEQPAAVPERVAVGLLDRRARGRADVREEQRRLDVRRELAQVRVAPRRRDAPVARRRAAVAGAVPAEPEAVPVGRLHPHARVQALIDEPVLGAGTAARRAGWAVRSTPSSGTSGAPDCRGDDHRLSASSPSRAPTPLSARVRSRARARTRGVATALRDGHAAARYRRLYTWPRFALLAQLVEHFHGKEGVSGSSPEEGSQVSRARPRPAESGTALRSGRPAGPAGCRARPPRVR